MCSLAHTFGNLVSKSNDKQAVSVIGQGEVRVPHLNLPLRFGVQFAANRILYTTSHYLGTSNFYKRSMTSYACVGSFLIYNFARTEENRPSLCDFQLLGIFNLRNVHMGPLSL